eukprot:GHVQ01019671.1.p1 GENE.GHVQ01019671.1~~GHVQ01019671.1.p1  ORF type:complete len:398 (+),score=58.86 GHVQ01019671.1:365-1558(+)
MASIDVTIHTHNRRTRWLYSCLGWLLCSWGWCNGANQAVTVAHAWWDEGHMILAAVARLQLDQSELDLLENELSLWDDLYPGMSELPSCAVWADHLKCTRSSSYCHGQSSFDSLELFDQWHYVEVPYNPQHIDLLPIYKLLPLPETGAAWALRSITQSLDRTHDALSSPPLSPPTSSLHPFPAIPHSPPHHSLGGVCSSVPQGHSAIPGNLRHYQVCLQPWYPATPQRGNRHTVKYMTPLVDTHTYDYGQVQVVDEGRGMMDEVVREASLEMHPQEEQSMLSAERGGRDGGKEFLTHTQTGGMQAQSLQGGEAISARPERERELRAVWNGGVEGYVGGRDSRHRVGTELSLNLQLRLLIHIMGDIHQPLHCVDTFTKVFANGDKGGNAVCAYRSRHA